MKAIKSFLLFAFSLVVVSSCFEPPEFSTTPEIELNDLYFRDLSSGLDSLVLEVRFKDGDGDLGLDPNIDLNSPYHELNFFLDDVDGKITTIRSRSKPGNEDLPPFETPYTCTSYAFDTLYVTRRDPQTNRDYFDETYNVIDSFFVDETKYYALLDTFYVRKNLDHYNILVKYLVKDGNTGEFNEFDWQTLYPFPRCGENFNGRFPILFKDGKKNPLEGVIRYGMVSSGFNPLFSSKILKLKVQIKDRALNISNEIETPEFTLVGIKR